MILVISNFSLPNSVAIINLLDQLQWCMYFFQFFVSLYMLRGGLPNKKIFLLFTFKQTISIMRSQTWFVLDSVKLKENDLHRKISFLGALRKMYLLQFHR